MKIAIFSDTFFPQINGVASVARGSAESLVGLGHEVMVFVPVATKNRHLLQSLKYKVVPLLSAPIYFYPGERAVLPFSLTAWRELKNFKPDVIHSHTPFGAGWFAVLISKILGIKLVGTHHTFYDHYLKHVRLDYSAPRKLSWTYTNLYYNACDLVLSPTESLKNELVSHGLRKPCKILINPIDTETFHPVSSEEKEILKKKFSISGPSVVYMGRLSYEKSIDQVIHAFAKVCQEFQGITLMIVGDGPEKSALMELCKTLDISSSVVFTGVLRGSKLAEALSANEIFVTASASENMPLSTLEGQACGLPLLAVSEKGMREIVEEGVNGFLSPANDILSMSVNILKIFKDPELLQKMSSASRKSAEKYSERGVTESLLAMYTSIL